MIDKYRVNAWSARKAIDEHLKEKQKQAKPKINVDVLVGGLVIFLSSLVILYIFGYQDGLNDGKKEASKTSQREPYSPQTKCVSYDIRDGQKYCLRWKRV